NGGGAFDPAHTSISLCCPMTHSSQMAASDPSTELACCSSSHRYTGCVPGRRVTNSTEYPNWRAAQPFECVKPSQKICENDPTSAQGTADSQYFALRRAESAR